MVALTLFAREAVTFLVAISLLGCAESSFAQTQTVLCVDAHAKSSLQNGTCWENPYLDLEPALERARQDPKIKAIWMAQGVYKPSKTYSPINQGGKKIEGGAISLPENNPGITIDQQLMSYQDNVASYNHFLKTFDLVNNVDLYGGFQGQRHIKGGEKSVAERSLNVQAYPTILDGDIDGLPFTPDNVWHVIFAGNDITLQGVNVKLDRLFVRNGNARAAPYYPTHYPLALGQIPKQYHDDGGGLAVFAKSQIELKDMVFENNAAVSGGAIYAQDGSHLSIRDSLFKNNHAYNGGAITVSGGGPHDLSKSNQRVTTLDIHQCQFTDNSAYIGTAILARDVQFLPPKNNAGAKLTIEQSTFNGAEGEPESGTIMLMFSSAQFLNTTFKNNQTSFFPIIDCMRSSVGLQQSGFLSNDDFLFLIPLSQQCIVGFEPMMR